MQSLAESLATAASKVKRDSSGANLGHVFSVSKTDCFVGQLPIEIDPRIAKLVQNGGIHLIVRRYKLGAYSQAIIDSVVVLTLERR